MIEDFERARELDEMYLIESQKQMEEEWQEWEEIHKQPARVELITVKKKNHGQQGKRRSSKGIAKRQ